MGTQQKFLYTSDSGVNWNIYDTPDSTSITKICFPDSLHGYGVGNNGNIIKYVYQKPSDVQPEPGKISSFYLAQNYPNPFNPSTTIKYSIPEDGFVKLAVYNMLGEEVATIVNTTQKAGRYEVNFNASQFVEWSICIQDRSSKLYSFKEINVNEVIAKQLRSKFLKAPQSRGLFMNNKLSGISVNDCLTLNSIF